MAKPKVMHALLTEPDAPLVPGREYPTLCDITWEYQPLLSEEVRERFVCALCHQEQMTELLAAITDLQDRYNFHLTTYHHDHIQRSTTDEQH